MRILGALFVVFGLLISLSIVGAVIGVPMIFLGLLFIALGGRRKTIINNVVTVNGPAPSLPEERVGFFERLSPARPMKLIEPPVVDVRAEPTPKYFDAGRRTPTRTQAPEPSYDVDKWEALIQEDNDIARVVDALEPFGRKYVDQLAAAYLMFNDKELLPVIIKKVIATAKADGVTS